MAYQHKTRINIRQLAERLAVSKQSIWRWYTVGDFPHPHYLGQNRVWFLDEIESWESEHTRTKPAIPVNERNQGHAA